MMTKTQILILSILALSGTSWSTPISDGRSCSTCPDPVTNSPSEKTELRSKRSVDFSNLFQSISGMVTGIVHEVAVHKERRQSMRPQPVRIYNIGNGRHNANRVTINEANDYDYYQY